MSASQGMFHSVPFLSSYDRVSWLQSGEVDCWRKVIGGVVRVPLTKYFGRLHAVSREQVYGMVRSMHRWRKIPARNGRTSVNLLTFPSDAKKPTGIVQKIQSTIVNTKLRSSPP